jgi:PDZ domain-containing protein
VDAIASWLDPSDAVVPRELLFPDDETGEEVERRQAIMFSTSQSDAVAAALNLLGLPVSDETVVTVVYGDSPADGVLQPRDTILAVDGVEVTDPVQVAEAIRAEPAGTSFTITVERDGEQQDVTVTSVANPDDPSLPFIGIGVGSFYTGEFPIDFTLEDVGGPSAGLMFATGIVDMLTPDDLTSGRHVAGTGTIQPDGTVGPIGGIRQKLAGARDSGAELFLMPKSHCAEAAAHVPDGLTVVPVTSLTEAVDAIRAWTAGDEVPQCPAEAV